MQKKKHGPPALVLRETVARTGWASIMKITTQSQFAPPSLAFCAFDLLPLLFCLKGLSHSNTNLLLQIVVVGGELALDLGRCLSNGCHQFVLRRGFEYPVDLT